MIRILSNTNRHGIKKYGSEVHNSRRSVVEKRRVLSRRGHEWHSAPHSQIIKGSNIRPVCVARRTGATIAYQHQLKGGDSVSHFSPWLISPSETGRVYRMRTINKLHAGFRTRSGTGECKVWDTRSLYDGKMSPCLPYPADISLPPSPRHSRTSPRA